MLLVAIHNSEDAGAFKALLESKGYTYSLFTSLAKLFKVDCDLADFTLGEESMVAYVEDDPIQDKPLFTPNSTDVPLPNITFRPNVDPVGDSWGIARICRRRNPWGYKRLPYDVTSSFYRYTRTGEGVDIYILDNDFQPSHAEFGGRMRWHDGSTNTVINTGFNHHGMAVSSCAGGNTCGIATGAQLHISEVGLGYNQAHWISLFDDVLTHYNNNPDQTRPAVLNMSYGGVGYGFSQGLKDAISALIDAGIVVCFAAGNSRENADADGIFHMPLEYDSDCIVTGGTNLTDEFMFSNGGGTANSSIVDIYAPGWIVRLAKDIDGYFSSAGTSFASPLTAGVIGCMLGGYSRPTSRVEVQAIKAKLIENSTKDVLRIPDTYYPNIVNNRLLYLDPEIAIEPIAGLTTL